MADNQTDTHWTLKRLAKTIRDEAGAIEAQQIKDGGRVKDAIPTDRDYQRGRMDGLRQSADLLDDGERSG